MAAPTDRNIKIRFAFSVIGILVGASIFFVFGLHYENWNTALWGLLSALGAAVTLFVHVQYTRDVWRTFPYRLRYFMLTGCFIQLAGVCGFVAYLTLAITQHQHLKAYGNGFYLATIWCFMTWKWGFLLFYFSRAYRQLYLDIYTILPQEAKDDYKPYSNF
ncbi:heme transporter HRG1-like [Gigantopelta aegis]|uniref:heme transporter HRG1-like n=1 Tax=Gigantopelta aegis TaxID=1735272 RepID=UPI001B889A9F|nr:heme transporter HRG1-like [Gigantopelta aegis]